MTAIVPSHTTENQESEVREIRKVSVIHSTRLRPGHSIWKWQKGEIARITDEDYEDSVVNLDENGAPVEKSRRLKIEPVAYYFSALNLKNAIRQARRQGLPIPAIEFQFR